MEVSSNTPAIVTGGASGLGAATARAIAAKGAKVALFDMNEEKGNALAEELGGVFCKVNVTSDEEVDAGFAKAREAHGQERILVNCAGIGNAIKTASRDKQSGEIKSFPISAFRWESAATSTLRVGMASAGRVPSGTSTVAISFEALAAP